MAASASASSVVVRLHLSSPLSSSTSNSSKLYPLLLLPFPSSPAPPTLLSSSAAVLSRSQRLFSYLSPSAESELGDQDTAANPSSSAFLRTMEANELLQVSLDKHQLEIGKAHLEKKEKYEFDQYLKHFERRLLYQPGLWYPFPSSDNVEKTSLSFLIEPEEGSNCITKDCETIELNDTINSVKPSDVLALATRAMMASRKAASLAEQSSILAAELDEPHILGFKYKGCNAEICIKEKVTVRSKRLLERKTKKRKVVKKPNNLVLDDASSITKSKSKKIDVSDPLRLFLLGPETKQLLTVKEEKDLFVQIENLMRLEDVRQRLCSQFDREPTLAEWAQAVGMNIQVLQSCLSSGRHNREKLIYANFRLVVHVARKYEGKGLSIHDLLQEGSRGLMRSLENFKPKAGCRFPTYAYWWIRQSIRKAIFLNSRTIRLPENVFTILKKIKNARRLCIQEGHLPTNEEIAKRVGIRVEKLERLLITSRNPVSIQGHVWSDQDTTFQEITADPEVESPDRVVAKQLMRQHVRNLLTILNSRERKIIQYRFGISGNERKSLTDIGLIYGLSKERVRQLESRALDKLKECLQSQGLQSYLDLLA